MDGFHEWPSNRGGRPIVGESPATRPAPVTEEESGYPTRRVKSGGATTRLGVTNTRLGILLLLLPPPSLTNTRPGTLLLPPWCGTAPWTAVYSVSGDTVAPQRYFY